MPPLCSRGAKHDGDEDQKLKRVSSNTEVQVEGRKQLKQNTCPSMDLPSPPKFAKFITENTAEDKAICSGPAVAKAGTVGALQAKLMAAPQSADIFDDSFLPDDLSNLSCMNEKQSYLRNSRSCPNTPNFEVCSEELNIKSNMSENSNTSRFSIDTTHDKHVKNSNSLENKMLKSPLNFSQDISEILICQSNTILEDCLFNSSIIIKENECDDRLKLKHADDNENNKLHGQETAFKTPQNINQADIRKSVNISPHPKAVKMSETEMKFDNCIEKNSTLNTIRGLKVNLDKQATPEQRENHDIHRKVLHEINFKQPQKSPASFIFSDSDNDVQLEPSPTVSVNIRSNKQVER